MGQSLAFRIIVLVVAFTPCAGLVPSAAAHPLGNFSINHHTALHIEGAELRIRFRIDMAEIATAQQMPQIDVDSDKHISPEEENAYLRTVAKELTAAQMLKIDGQAAAMPVVGQELVQRPGAGNLPTLLITLIYRIPLPGGVTQHTIEYSDGSFDQRFGWREIIATAAGGARLVSSSVPKTSRSHELEQYPTDLGYAPPTDWEAHVVVDTPADAGNAAPPTTAATTLPASAAVSAAPPPVQKRTGLPGTVDRFSELVTQSRWSVGTILFSLGAAFIFGSMHALSPGHGKTVVAAYLVGSRGTVAHAVLLGAIVTFTHVSAVFALGLLVLTASAYIVPEQILPWLGFASGVLIVGIGLWQFTQRFAAQYAPAHSHGDGSTHAHAGGRFAHSHGPGGHTHELPDRITLGSLFTLGISGGIVPCPSALVVLLSAIAFNRVAIGLALIVAFSVGLATVLIVIGMLVLRARQLLDRFGQSASARWAGRLSLVSSALIAILGVIIAVQALVQGGVIQINLRSRPPVASSWPNHSSGSWASPSHG